MDITNASPEKFAAQIKASYPFHFAIRDLYARFCENHGFQQTRGLIRLMRVVVARLFSERRNYGQQPRRHRCPGCLQAADGVVLGQCAQCWAGANDGWLSGLPYVGPFAVPTGTVCVLAIAEKQGFTSAPYRLDIVWDAEKTVFEIQPQPPYRWQRRHRLTTTRDAYDYLGRLKKFQAQAWGARITINGQQWVDLSMADDLRLGGDTLEATVNHLRGLLPDGEVEIDVEAMYFPTGQLLQDWIADVRTELTDHEVQPC